MGQRTVILDFDGTIADSFSLILEIFHDLSGGNHRSKSAEEVSYFRNLPLKAVMKELELQKWRLPVMLFRGRRRMGKRLNEVELFAGMSEAIKELSERGYQLFIVSSNSTKNVRHFLGERGLEAYFQDIYGGVGLLGKTRVLRRIMKNNGLAANECVYIGDELRDVEGSKRARVACIAVSWGFSSAKLLKASKPFALVEKPEELVLQVEKWAQKRK